MKKLFTTKRGRLHGCYLLGLGGMLLLIVLILFTRSDVPSHYEGDGYSDISQDLRLSSGNDVPVSLDSLGSYFSTGDTALSLYYMLPSELSGHTSFVYRTKDVYTKLYVDDTLLYETTAPKSRFYNRSPGNLWNVADIDSTYAGHMLRIEVTMVYDQNAVTLDHTYLGDKLYIVTDLVHQKLWALLLSVFMMMIGLYFIIWELLPTSQENSQKYGTFYLGIYSFLIGVWSLLETNVLQFFIADGRLLQLINNMVMIVGTLPLFLYLDCEMDILKSSATEWLCRIDIAYILFCFFMQLTGIMDLHDILIGSHLALIAGGSLYLYWIIRGFLSVRKKRQDKTPFIFQMCGIGALFFTAILEFAKYTKTDAMDRAGLLRIGMFLFIILCGISSQMTTYRLIKQGMQYDIVSTLAYQDGLTGLGNRTAYLEYLDECIKSHLPQLGIVFLDINNLKQVNDHLGHDMGDILIKEASHIIAESFGRYGNSYRIGGDEFCILISAQALDSVYHTAEEQFEKMIDDANTNNPNHLEIRIAHGFSICRELSKEKIDDAIKRADEAMYADKARLKETFA